MPPGTGVNTDATSAHFGSASPDQVYPYGNLPLITVSQIEILGPSVRASGFRVAQILRPERDFVY